MGVFKGKMKGVAPPNGKLFTEKPRHHDFRKAEDLCQSEHLPGGKVKL